MYTMDTRITLGQTDCAGRLYFARLFEMAHQAYEEFLDTREIPLSKLLEMSQFHLPICACHGEFSQPIGLGEAISIELILEKISRRSFTLHYRFLGEEGQEKAWVKTTHASVGSKTHESIDLPDQIRRALESLSVEINTCAPTS